MYVHRTHCQLTRRQAFQASLKERGLDPFIGYNLANHLAHIPGLEEGKFERHCVPLTPSHSGTSQPLSSCKVPDE
jgi:hypothetical protein